MNRPFQITLCIFLLTAAGCASLGTYNAATGRREFIFIPTDQEVAMGQDIHQQLTREFKFINSGPQLDRVRRVGRKLAQVSDRQDFEYNFYLIDKDEMNAFTIPGGRIYIFSGLLNKMRNDDELASVLGHEIGHSAARHTVKKYQAAVTYQFIGEVVLSRISAEEQVRRIASLSSDTLMSLIFSAYGRRDEYEADRLGLKYMSLAGYNLNGMIQMFEILNEKSEQGSVPLILRSHPYLHDRKTAAKKEIERIKAEDAIH